jgi:pimeloyl-ACP methyl ester carboxylesterase
MGVVTLSDGRRLAYAELGDPRGAPIIHHHGVPGSRVGRQADPAVYREAGVRMITPDRPGSGLSDLHWNSGLAGWGDDVRELADALSLDRFGITGLSGGGVFALAAAATLGDRVTAVVLAGCPAPTGRRRATAGMHARLIAGLAAAGRFPWLLRAGSGLAGAALRTWPEFFVDATNRDSEADTRWLTLPSVRAAEIHTVREAFRHGADGYIHDVSLISRAWGFRLEDVRAPVNLWHGDHDTVIPLHHAKYLASVLPDARLVVCRGEGHMVMWGHLRAILATAARRTLEPAARQPA